MRIRRRDHRIHDNTLSTTAGREEASPRFNFAVGTPPRAIGVTLAVTCAGEDWTGIGPVARAAQEK
jgi:hypothetical protein